MLSRPTRTELGIRWAALHLFLHVPLQAPGRERRDQQRARMQQSANRRHYHDRSARLCLRANPEWSPRRSFWWKTGNAHRCRGDDHYERSFRRRVILGTALAVRGDSRHRWIHAGIRCARNGKNKCCLVPSHGARQLRRHLRFHDQPRPLRHFKLGPALLAGFTFLGLIRIPPLHWRWLFWVPAGITLVVGTCMALIVRDTPEEANFPPVNPHEKTGGRVQVEVLDVFKIIVTNPVIWIVAGAYACTGSVRQGIDQWFPRFLQEVHHPDYQSIQFQLVAFFIPLVASVGSLVSGLFFAKGFRCRLSPV